MERFRLEAATAEFKAARGRDRKESGTDRRDSTDTGTLMLARTHERMHAHTHARTHMHTCTHAHTRRRGGRQKSRPSQRKPHERRHERACEVAACMWARMDAHFRTNTHSCACAHASIRECTHACPLAHAHVRVWMRVQEKEERKQMQTKAEDALAKGIFDDIEASLKP